MHTLFEYPEGKTHYQILNEEGDKTTISRDNWVADILQVELPDVHDRIQKAYDRVLQEKPNLSRRQRGNMIRIMAMNKARMYQKTMKDILGWNTDELLNLL